MGNKRIVGGGEKSPAPTNAEKKGNETRKRINVERRRLFADVKKSGHLGDFSTAGTLHPDALADCFK
jgi:hypothetical protein